MGKGKGRKERSGAARIGQQVDSLTPSRVTAETNGISYFFLSLSLSSSSLQVSAPYSPLENNIKVLCVHYVIKQEGEGKMMRVRRMRRRRRIGRKMEEKREGRKR